MNNTEKTLQGELNNKPPLPVVDIDSIRDTLLGSSKGTPKAETWTTLEWAQARMLMLHQAYEKINIQNSQIKKQLLAIQDKFFAGVLFGAAFIIGMELFYYMMIVVYREDILHILEPYFK